MMEDSDRGFAILSTLNKILRGLGKDPSLHASSSSAPNPIYSVFTDLPRKINEDVYEIRSPATKPTVQIIFFHGFELGDYRDAYWTDWLSGDRSQCWLETWLVQELPGARILSVSYDSSLGQTSTFGRADLHVIAETLVSSLIKSADAKVGQDNCPIILVGHSVGGLVMKKLIVTAAQSTDNDRVVIENFMSDVRGFFFYSTPHSGSILAKAIKDSGKGLLTNDLEIFSKDSARLDEAFHILRSRFQWKVHGLGELHETELVSSFKLLGLLDVVVKDGFQNGFRGIVVEEASARHGMLGNYNTVPANHINICKPDEKQSHSFRILVEFIEGVIHEAIVPLHQCQGLPDYPVKVEEQARDIQGKLKAGQVLGIVGMGGIGKTTLAKEVFNNISGKFEYTCFVDHVKGIRNHELGDWLHRQFHRNGSKVDRHKWSDVKNKKTLIIMDDVDSEDQLRVLPKLGHFGEGSHVIITTRDQSVLKFYESCNCHEVGFLLKDDAMKLFCSHVFGQEKIPIFLVEKNPQLMKDVQAVVEKCGGLPLTLEVLGRYLRGHEKDANFWAETISRLGKAQGITGGRDDRVWATLRVSCDALIREEREMFLGAATFFFKKPVEEALAAWSATCGEPETRWANLLSRCLVKEVNKTRFDHQCWEDIDYKEVWVHEQLRDLAKSLAPGSMVYASDEKNADKFVQMINANQLAEEIQYLNLSYPRQYCYSDLGQERRTSRVLRLVSLFNLKQLKYMELMGIYLQGSRQYIPRNISLLSWMNPENQSFPICCLEEMKNLAVLELSYWKAPQAFPEALEKLANLRILSLASIEALDRLPEHIGRLSRLKDLKLLHVSLSKLPESFGNLSRLERLTFNNVQLTELPQSFGNLSSLKHLIFINVQLIELPESFGNLSCLQRLSFTNVKLTRVPVSFGNLSSLQHLSFSSSRLTKLPESFGNLSSLQSLTLTNEHEQFDSTASSENLSSQLEQLSLEDVDWKGSSSRNIRSLELPESFGNLTSLAHLRFTHVQLMELPESFGKLSSLEQLSFEYVPLMELPRSFGNLSSLVTLTFISCKMMATFPHSMGQLSGLHSLVIWRCDRLKDLGEMFGKLSGLKYLDLRCSSLERLPASFGLLCSLKTLHLRDTLSNPFFQFANQADSNESGGLKSLPDNFGNLQALRELYISQPELQELPSSFRLLTSLKELTICAPRLESLPENLGEFTSLVTLDLEVGSVKALPESVGQLSSLHKLRFLSNCAEILPENLGQLVSLQEMDLEVGRVMALPKSVGQLSSLHKLRFLSNSAEILPENLGQLASLQEMDLEVGRVKALPKSVGQLPSLRALRFVSNNAKTLPDSLGQLASLQKMHLEVARVKVLPESVGQLSSLHDLHFVSCVVETLPQSLGKLASLQTLSIGSGDVEKLPLHVLASGLATVPESVGRLSSLTKLTVSNCDKLECLPESLGHLSSLQEVNLSRCGKLKRLPVGLGSPLPENARSNIDSSGLSELGGMRLVVDQCRLLDDAVLTSLGWVKSIVKPLLREVILQPNSTVVVPLKNIAPLVMVLSHSSEEPPGF